MHQFSEKSNGGESEELSNKLKAKTKAAADTKSPPMANSEADEDAINKITSDSQKSREEGELSSYDDDDYRAISSSPQVTSGNAAPVEAFQSVPAYKTIQDAKAGNSDSSNNFVREVSSRATLQPNHHKGYEKNRGPFVPFVISFSDDDSGSDSENSRQQKHVLNEGSNVGADRSKKPPETSLPNSQKIQQTKSEVKMLPKKVSLSCTVVSSMTCVNGDAPLSGGPYPSSRNSNMITKVVDHDQEGKPKVHLNPSKLQDLRQLIALRESELKLKSANQTKTSTSASHRESSFTKAIGRRAASVDNVESEAIEPEKKRQKISELQSHQTFAARQREVPGRQSTLGSEKSVLANYNQHKAGDLRKEVPLRASQSSLAGSRKQGGSQGPVPSTNLPIGVENGTGSVTKSKQTDRNSKIANPVSSSEQRTQTENEAANDILRKEINVTSDSYFAQRNDQHRISNENALKSNDAYQERSLNLPDGNLRITDKADLNNPSFWNNICSGSSNMEVQALLDLEESHDKELEEAQEHRQKCEVEERKARDAYRKAQRALAEANARCSYLYSKREIYSAQFQSFMMENSSLFWSLGPNDQFGSRLNPSNNFSNFNLLPTSSSQVQAELDASNHHTFGPNIHSANDIHQNVQDLHVSGQNVASDPLSEPDDDSSMPQKEDDVANGVYCPDNYLTMSGDEDGEPYHKIEKGLQYERKDESSGDTEKEINGGCERQEQLDSAQDSLLLEASLRSKLFERLQRNALTRKRGPSPVGSVDEKIGDDNGGEKVESDSLKMPPPGGDKAKHSELPGPQSTSYSTLSCSILRSALRHLKIPDPTSLIQSRIRSPEVQFCNLDDENGDGHLLSENQPSDSSRSLAEASLMDFTIGEVGSFSCNLAIDPLWPLCMYELRGKCNNDECPWQHVKNYSCNDSQVAPSQRKLDAATALTKSMDCLVSNSPTYLVDLDVLQADFWPYKSILTRGYGYCWNKCFSASLVLSSLLPTDLNINEPLLHGSEPRIEAHTSWNRQLSSFCGRNGTLKQADQHISSNDQALELAILNLSNEVNKQKGRLEALKVLAQAVDADPRSAVLWIVYLQIYYSNQKSIGKDDMFRYPVQHIENSYELWLLYINSRTRLEDRVAAYDEALSVLCRNTSGPDVKAKHASECLLDISLQRIDCLCMSGNVIRALEIIYGFFASAKRSNELNQILPPDVITCFTIYDKCVFWVCYIYVAIYRKLPDAIVQRFEYQKELSAIEWPDIQLTIEKKQQANSLLEIAADSLALHIDCESLENEETLKAVHLFCVNHVRCVAVLEGLECSRNLLDKYTKLYPSCLELVLMSAQTAHESESETFAGFEKALTSWLEDVPGIQCLYNQYAESALRSGKFDLAKELMERWFNSVWKVEYLDDESIWSSPKSASASETDVVFGLLNFSLHKILHNDHTNAQLPLDKALKAATAENYTHCVREHALFSLASSSPHNGDAHFRNALKILSGYLVDARASVGSEPFSRDYIRTIQKPRIQNLVSKLLNPCSNFSLVNSVLEVWYGPSLLPQSYDKLSDMVEFVEAVMGILPSNYQLAICACKLIIQSSKTAKVPPNVSFWASSLIVNALFQAVPIAPEFAWLEASNILHYLNAESESFHKKALSIYPFSIKLWKSYLGLFSDTSTINRLKAAARQKGINLIDI